ncbi:MAG: hypothetical protein SFX73_04315 [Kofleriaceae bacterium]|nr:hypothetical protein [Kofleriaceae bacterium]
MKWWLVAVALGACKADQPVPATSPQVAPTTIAPPPVVVDAAPSAPVAAAPIEVPDAVGLPLPLAHLRPYMKEGEVKGKLAAFKAADAWPKELVIPDGAEVVTVIPGVFAYPSFYDGRLVGVTLLSQPETLLTGPTRAKWGAGQALIEDRYIYGEAEAWTAAAGWRVELRTGPNLEFHKTLYGNIPPKPPYAELLFHVEEPRKAEKVAAKGPSFVAISKLLGQPLDAALTLFGDDVHREIADDADAVAEADPAQGYGRVVLEDLDKRWEVTVRVDKTSGRVAYILLAGDADDHAALLKRLEAAFGPRRAVVNDTGDVVIGFGGRGDVHASKVGDSWEIELSR